MRLPIVVSVLVALVALLHVHASTMSTPAAVSDRSPVAAVASIPFPTPKTGKATAVASDAPTCHMIMQCLSSSLVTTPSTADKPDAVMVDVDKAGVMMVYNRFDSIAIPVPGGKPR